MPGNQRDYVSTRLHIVIISPHDQYELKDKEINMFRNIIDDLHDFEQRFILRISRELDRLVI